MFSENFENAPNNIEPPNNVGLPNNIEPPNDDVFHVKDELRRVLKYFKDCNAISSVAPDIDEQINKIREQGREFHACLQSSIAQSNRFENHANNALDYLEILNDSNFDENHVSDILQILTENAENNKNETREIQKKYESVEKKLQEINAENRTRNIQDRRKLQKLIETRNDLEEYLKRYESCGFTSLIILGGSFVVVKEYKESLDHPFIVIMVILTVLCFLYTRKLKSDIQKTEKEVNKLQKMINLSNEISELRKSYDNLNPIIMQMNTFSNYWHFQHNILEDLSCNLEKITEININNINNQAIKQFINPMKPRWQSSKILCDNYIKTVRRTITDVNNV